MPNTTSAKEIHSVGVLATYSRNRQRNPLLGRSPCRLALVTGFPWQPHRLRATWSDRCCRSRRITSCYGKYKNTISFSPSMLHIHKVGNVYYDNMHGLSVVTSYQPTVDLQSILRASKLWFREKEREREMV